MSSTFKKLISRFRDNGNSGQILISAFGKHPGWDDHIDGIGVETDILIKVKSLLYDGISDNIQNGTWDKLPEDHLIAEFDHVFLWFIAGHIVVGFMWSSIDGKGRDKYPFIVCVQCYKLPLQWIFMNILPCLEEVKVACKSTSSAIQVQSIIQNAGQELQQKAQQFESFPKSIIEFPDALSKLASCPEMGPDRQGLYRILYHIDREVGHNDTGISTSLRVASSKTAKFEHIRLWSSYLLNRFGTDSPALILIPPENQWLDLIVGEATEAKLFCIRASLKVIPITSSIPYSIDKEYIVKVNKLFQEIIR